MKRKVVNSLLPAPYGRMTAEEFDAEVARFDSEMVGVPGKPLSQRQKSRLRREDGSASHRERGGAHFDYDGTRPAGQGRFICAKKQDEPLSDNRQRRQNAA
jgi:hypothetical protein